MRKDQTNARGARARAIKAILLALCLCAFSAALGEGADALRVTKTDVRYMVDFSYMQSEIPGSVAWLYQPDTTIDQPVMLGTDTNYYLKRSFNGRSDANGAIFVKGAKAPDFSAPTVTLYGVNCLDQTLFGSLSAYRDEAYYQLHPTLYLLTLQGDYQLDIFAGTQVSISDAGSWNVSDTTTGLWEDDLVRVLAESFIKPDPALLPVEGDAWAVLATEATKNQARTRYIIYARKRPIDYQNAPAAELCKLKMDSRVTTSGLVRAENVGEWMLYAQNDPVWNRLVFECEASSKKRPFGDGGCGPTAVAIAVANLVDKEHLVRLNDHAASSNGFRFCSCSVNEYRCNRKHLQYRLTTPDEFARYLPVAIGSFATGNNAWGVKGRTKGYGTSMYYVEALCEVFDLTFTKLRGMDAAIAALEDANTLVVASTMGRGSPFTNTSHFIVLAGVKDGYLYVLDPLQREKYGSLDGGDYLEVIQPGLVRLTLENAAHSNIYPEFSFSSKK